MSKEDWTCGLCGATADTLYYYKDISICPACYKIKKRREPQHCQGRDVDYTIPAETPVQEDLPVEVPQVSAEVLARTCPTCKGVWNTIRGLRMHLSHGCKIRN